MPTASITDPDDPRVAVFRLNERGLTPRSQRQGVQRQGAQRQGVQRQGVQRQAAPRTEATPSGLFVAEGDLVVERALDAGCRLRALLTSPRHARRIADEQPDVTDDVHVYVADDDVRRAITGLGVPLEVVGLFERPAVGDVDALIRAARRLVMIDRVDNPTNVGAIVRSATALGADGLLLDHTSADPLARRALRVSMGAALRLPTARVADAASALARLHAAGFETVALTPDADATPVSQVTAAPRLALVLGAERTGLDPAVLADCTHRCRIPMAHGVDSLNVAAAAAVACFALFAPHD